MKINKTLLISFFALFILAFSASACFCSDTDAKQQFGNAWGDNALLGGNTSIDFKQANIPLGCTATREGYTCQDHCDGTTLVEYYCGYKQPTNMTYQDCHKESYKDCHNETKQVCSWKFVDRHWKNVCNDITKKVCTTKYKQVCTTKTKIQNFFGDSVILSKLYENSDQCIPETPEFGGIAAGIAVIGAIAGIVIVRKKN